MTLKELLDKLSDMDPEYHNYEVVCYDTQDNASIILTKITINEKNKEVRLTNNNKYSYLDR